MASELANRTRAQQAAAQERKTPQQIMTPVAGALRAALAGRVDGARFMQAAVAAFQQTPKLRECSEESILGALFASAQLGLEVNTPQGLAYLVPYAGEATFIMGYRGFVRLFYNAGARSVQWFMVREGDQFRIGSNAQVGMVYEWVQKDLDDKRPWTGAVAQIETANGGIVWNYMTREQILARRPKKWTGTPWEKWPEQMALKTVLRDLSKRAPQSTDELAIAREVDETVQKRLPDGSVHLAARIPVEGEKRPQEARPGPQDVPRVTDPPARPDAAPPPPPEDEDAPPEETDEERFDRMSAEEFNAYQDSRGPV